MSIVGSVMRLAVLGKHRRVLTRGAAIVLVAGAAAGCSSDVTRFQDSILTGSSRPQQAAPAQQAYPGDYSQLDQTTTATVASAPRRGGGILNRVGLNPRPQGDVGGYSVAAAPSPSYPAAQPFPSAQQAQPVYSAPARQAVTTGSALAPVVTRASLDATVTGSTPQIAPVAQATQQAAPMVQSAQPIAVASGDGGWSRAGGTQVSIKQGETVYNLSRRFGVPVDAILKANGMSSADALAAGQQVVIPTYVHSARAPVSAPDANPNVADARSSTGSRTDAPVNKVPVPGQVPGDRTAVLPQQPKLKEQEASQQTAPTDPQRAGAANGGGYTVAAGDTLDAIARRNGTTTAALKQANGLSNGVIRIGQKLVIPAGGAAVAARPAPDTTTTASVPAAANAKPAPQQADKVTQQASLDKSTPPDATGISRMRWPVRGRVISGFGGNSGGKRNDGIDIAVPSGTPVRAAENGVVIYAGDGLKEFGNTVLVRHENGLVTVYGHAGEINVQRGQQVRRGDEIAKAGMSGSADAPKLHFEVRRDSTPVDPTTYLE
jgi:murein DD-endopeptidase MepM/ murein hydrolase activator NlpD